jgi:molybdate transport system substrate-binding protein
MHGNSFRKFALACGVLLAAVAPRAAEAAEIKAYVSIALKSSMDELVPAYERATGNKVQLEIATVAALKKRLDDGEAFDVAVLTPAAISELVQAGKIDAATNAAVARAGLGVGIRKGGRKPDISTVNAFKDALLAAKSIGYTDPALGGASGVYTAKMIESLKLKDELKDKTVLAKGSPGLAEAFARGEIELGLTQISELLPMKDVEVVGPYPADLQNYTVFAGAIASASKEKEAAAAFLKRLASPEAAAVYKAKGLEPGA